MLKARRTKESAAKAELSWLRLSTSQSTQIDLVAQDDAMAMGARKACEDFTSDKAFYDVRSPLGADPKSFLLESPCSLFYDA